MANKNLPHQKSYYLAKLTHVTVPKINKAARYILTGFLCLAATHEVKCSYSLNVTGPHFLEGPSRRNATHWRQDIEKWFTQKVKVEQQRLNQFDVKDIKVEVLPHESDGYSEILVTPIILLNNTPQVITDCTKPFTLKHQTLGSLETVESPNSLRLHHRGGTWKRIAIMQQQMLCPAIVGIPELRFPNVYSLKKSQKIDLSLPILAFTLLDNGTPVNRVPTGLFELCHLSGQQSQTRIESPYLYFEGQGDLQRVFLTRTIQASYQHSNNVYTLQYTCPTPHQLSWQLSGQFNSKGGIAREMLSEGLYQMTPEGNQFLRGEQIDVDQGHYELFQDDEENYFKIIQAKGFKSLNMADTYKCGEKLEHLEKLLDLAYSPPQLLSSLTFDFQIISMHEHLTLAGILQDRAQYLTELYFKNCTTLRDLLSTIGQLNGLRVLEIANVKSWWGPTNQSPLAPLALLTNLNSLILRSFGPGKPYELTPNDLQHLTGLINLKTLDIRDNPKISDLSVVTLKAQLGNLVNVLH